MAKQLIDVGHRGLDLWNRLEFTDKNYTKPVSRPGGFKGTAVDPVWNLKRVTEQLGPVGFFWGWKVLNERLDTFGEGQDAVTIHSLTVRAWFAQDDGSVREVDHIGHTKVAHWTRAYKQGEPRRFDVDEEFGKKSLTDALSKIMMSLGASADIWLGRFDGNKYVASDDVAEANAPAPKPPRRLDVVGKAPADAVEQALMLQTQDADPWKMDGVPVEQIVPLLETAISTRPWLEVSKMVPSYVKRLNLTEAETALVRKAFGERKDAEKNANLLAAG